MHSVKSHKVIGQIISLFYRLGIWHQGDQATAKELRIKIFYFIYFTFLPISFAIGAAKSYDEDEAIFLAEMCIASSVLVVKLWMLIWKQKKIQEFLNRICHFDIRDDDQFNLTNEKISKFVGFVVLIIFFINLAGFCIFVTPFIGSEKRLFFNVAFPLDYKNNEIAFWIAATFVITEIYLSIAVVLFSIIVWYFLLNCSLRYEVLGSEIRNMGLLKGVAVLNRISDKEQQRIFLRDLIAAINAHLHIMEYTTW